MKAHEMEVLIPEDHRLVVDLPETVRSGPARLILLTSGDSQPAREEPPAPRARGRMAALYSELSQDPRPFRDLSSEERRSRLRRVKGIARGLLSTGDELPSEEFARRKREEIELEERKLAR